MRATIKAIKGCNEPIMEESSMAGEAMNEIKNG